jgi:PAS domain S-box-containing protein
LDVVDKKGKFKFINPIMLELFLGYSNDEILEVPFLELVHPGDRDRVKNS